MECAVQHASSLCPLQIPRFLRCPKLLWFEFERFQFRLLSGRLGKWHDTMNRRVCPTPASSAVWPTRFIPCPFPRRVLWKNKITIPGSRCSSAIGDSLLFLLSAPKPSYACNTLQRLFRKQRAGPLNNVAKGGKWENN
jgi:hypothetical protein